MTKCNFNGLLLLLLLFVGLTILGSCNRIEGCLDPNSTNYTIEAEKNCCCEYPFLRLNVGYKVDEENLILGDTFQNDLGVNVTVENFAIYFSSFILIAAGGVEAQIEEKLQLPISEIVDDIILLKRADFNYIIGTFNQTENFAKVQFKIGLPAELSPIDFSDLIISENHPLTIQEDSMYNVSNQEFDYLFLSIKVEDQLFEFRLRPEISFSFDRTLETALGDDLIIPIDVNFKNLVEGIQSFDTRDQMQILIAKNIVESIQIL